MLQQSFDYYDDSAWSDYHSSCVRCAAVVVICTSQRGEGVRVAFPHLVTVTQSYHSRPKNSALITRTVTNLTYPLTKLRTYTYTRLHSSHTRHVQSHYAPSHTDMLIALDLIHPHISLICLAHTTLALADARSYRLTHPRSHYPSHSLTLTSIY